MELRRADKIAETLEQLVFSGDFQNGERLDELKLAQQFRVSRTPIREALQILVASGMAEQIPRRGVFVRQPGPVELMEMFETMAELEAVCGRLAATRITDAGLARLIEAMVGCTEAAKAGDLDAYYTQNEIFHQAVYKGAANAYLEKQALALQNRLKPYRKLQLRFRGRLEQSLDEHRKIVAALKAAEPDKAAQALRDHVAVQGEKFQKLIASLNS